MVLLRCVFLAIFCCSASPSIAADLLLKSGPQRTVMIELYTSEGCSSCPPAERYLNGLLGDRQLWRSYIPLAFHVDYWDYLGWHDRFASHANSLRQQRYARVLHARTVYTPEFFVNGKEWRRGVFGGRPPSTKEQAGILHVLVHGNRLVATFSPQHAYASPLQLHVAQLGMGLPSDIRAGENAGRKTIHQFVVLAHMQLASDKLQWQAAVPAISKLQPKRRALVVWVSEPGNPVPLQATGGFLK